MTDKISNINRFITSAQQMMQENEFKNDYVNLYKHLVGYSITPEHSKASRHEIGTLQDYFAQAKSKSSAKFFINEDTYWTYVEALFSEERPRYRELIKLYIPVAYSDLTQIATAIFDHLLSGQQTFFLKVAHQNRQDNICIWIMPSCLNTAIAFLQSLGTAIQHAPLFCPEYKGIGITRELSGSFNEMIADSLFKYIDMNEQTSLTDYIQFIETKYKLNGIAPFDREIVLRSLKCIANNQCPVTSTEFNIVQ